MISRGKLVVVAAFIVAAASAAQAGSDNQSDPTRGAVFGPQGQKQGGSAVNPAVHKSTRHVARHKSSKPKTESNKVQG